MQLLENKIIRLVEERGYMGTKYIPVIKQMVYYVQTYIKTNKSKNNKWEFLIPYELSSKIDCVNNLLIHIIIENNQQINSGGGLCKVFANNKIIDNKLDKGEIYVYGFSMEDNLFANTVFNSLTHELNHLQEIYERLSKNDSSTNLYKLAIKRNEVKNTIFSNNKDINKYIKNIFYRLFFKSELNALINSVYGDLESINSKRENFKSDLLHTQAYSIYIELRDNLNILNNINDNEWLIILNCFNKTSTKGNKISDIIPFKKSFKRKIIQKLNDLIKGIGKISSFYYDKKETLIDENDSIMINDLDYIFD